MLVGNMEGNLGWEGAIGSKGERVREEWVGKREWGGSGLKREARVGDRWGL